MSRQNKRQTEARIQKISSLDWSKPLAELVKESGIPCSYLSEFRYFFAASLEELQEKFGSLDWSLPNNRLGEIHGYSPHGLGIVRRRLNILSFAKYEKKRFLDELAKNPNAVPRFTSRYKSRYDWDSVDWERERDTDVADRLGCTRERVRQYRASRRKPDCEYFHVSKHGIAFIEKLKQFRDRLDGLPRDLALMYLDNQEWATESMKSGLKGIPIKQWVAKAKIRWTNKSYYYYIVNWDLPTSDLEELWGVSGNLFGNMRCHQLNRILPKWTRIFGNVPYDPLYHKAYREEVQKIAKYRDIMSRKDTNALLDFFWTCYFLIDESRLKKANLLLTPWNDLKSQPARENELALS